MKHNEEDLFGQKVIVLGILLSIQKNLKLKIEALKGEIEIKLFKGGNNFK